MLTLLQLDFLDMAYRERTRMGRLSIDRCRNLPTAAFKSQVQSDLQQQLECVGSERAGRLAIQLDIQELIYGQFYAIAIWQIYQSSSQLMGWKERFIVTRSFDTLVVFTCPFRLESRFRDMFDLILDLDRHNRGCAGYVGSR